MRGGVGKVKCGWLVVHTRLCFLAVSCVEVQDNCFLSIFVLHAAGQTCFGEKQHQQWSHGDIFREAGKDCNNLDSAKPRSSAEQWFRTSSISFFKARGVGRFRKR